MSNENSQVAERELLDIIEAQPTTVIASMARELIRRRSEPSGMTDWKVGDEAITSSSGERITLLRLQGHDIYSGPASDGRLWICRLSIATKPSDAVEFGVRECNMRPVPPSTCECRQPCSFCVQVIDEPEFDPYSMPSGCSAFFIESVPGETWAVTTACAEHKYLEGQPFTREPGPIHPCRAGCVYERVNEPVANPRKKFDDLVAQMAPELRARVDVRAAEMLREMCHGCDGHSVSCGLPDFCCINCPDIAGEVPHIRCSLDRVIPRSGDEPSVEQPHYVMYNSVGAEIGCVVGERARDSELRLQPAGTRFKKTAIEGCALHVHRSGWLERASDMSDDMPEVARIAAFEIHHDRLMREIEQLKKDRDLWSSESSRLRALLEQS